MRLLDAATVDEFCARGGGRGHRHRRGRAQARCCGACRRPSGPGSGSAAALTPAPTCSRCGRPRSRRRSSCGARSSRTARKAWRMLSLLGPAVLLGVALRLLSLDEVLARARRAGSASTVEGGAPRPIRSPASMSTSPRIMRWPKRSCGAKHERPRDLRHGPDGHAPRDLHAVPAALRAAAGAVAAAVPAARAPVDAGLCAAADRPRRAQGDQPSPAARPQDPPARPEAAGRQLRRQAGRVEHPARRAQGDRPRQGGRAAARARDRLLPPLRRRDRRAARLRRRDRHRIDHRPRRARPRQDRSARIATARPSCG